MRKRRHKQTIFRFKEKTLSKLIHPSKVKIMKLIKKNKQMNFLQLQRQLGGHVDYREVRRHSEKLLKAGILKRESAPRKRGRPVFLRLKKKIIG